MTKSLYRRLHTALKTLHGSSVLFLKDLIEIQQSTFQLKGLKEKMPSIKNAYEMHQKGTSASYTTVFYFKYKEFTMSKWGYPISINFKQHK